MFKAIPTFDGYEVSATGDVVGKRFQKILKPKHHLGYYSVGLYRSGKYHWRNVHRLVAMAWIGTPEGWENLDVAHNDGNSLNNCVSNLRWATRLENAHDRYKHGTAFGAHPGEKHHDAKLTETLVSEMRLRVAAGEPFMSVAEGMGLKKLTAYDAVTGKTWRTVSVPPVKLKEVKNAA